LGPAAIPARKSFGFSLVFSRLGKFFSLLEAPLIGAIYGILEKSLFFASRSPKISRAKGLARFSRYRVAQEAAPEENGIKYAQARCALLLGFVSDRFSG
jgi:hypothetical protein